MEERIKKPDWIKSVSSKNDSYKKVGELLIKYHLNTVCDAANCPNCGECYNSGTATFMLLGKNCTRNCTFCNVTKASPEQVDIKEPNKIALAVKELSLKHVVITSVTRDDLSDGGASHFARTIERVREHNKNVTVEVLIPDFQGNEEALKTVIAANPDVINHNVETISELYPLVRPMAKFERSIELLKNVKKFSSIPTKSGFMVGLGETEEQIYALLKKLHEADCDIVTIGQYLQPSKNHFKLKEYIHPDVFKRYYDYAMSIGFHFVVSSPLARSSYQAHKELDYINKK